MQVPVLAPLGTMQVRPCPEQQAVVPLVAVVQPVAPIAVQPGTAQSRGIQKVFALSVASSTETSCCFHTA